MKKEIIEKTEDKGLPRLDFYQLEEIYLMMDLKISLREIAREVERSASTIHYVQTKFYYPVKRIWNKQSARMRAGYTWRKMKANRKLRGAKKRLRDVVIRKYVIEMLVNHQYSPEDIAHMICLDRPGKKVSAKTIYNFIKHERPELKKYLLEKGKPRRPRITHRRSPLRQGAPKKRSLCERPIECINRTGEGHWEGDIVCSGKNGTGGLLSIRDRKTRKHFYMRIRNLQSKHVLGCLRVFFLQLPPHLRKSLTLDNGSEFAYSEMKKLEQYFKELKVYYCDAYQSWQKGTVEQGHRKLRWYFPKGTDFSTVSFAEIKRVENLINNKPAKCLGYRKPADVFEQSLHQLDSELSQLKLAA